MEIVKTSEPPNEPAGEIMHGWGLARHKVKQWLRMNISRRLPRLVWIGDEIDICVTFSQDPIDQDEPFAGLVSGGLAEIETQLRHMGITFDHGQGFGGRDWEWDSSLRGPINIRFRGRAKNPERRKEEKRPVFKVVAPHEAPQ